MSIFVEDKWIDANAGCFVLVPGGVTHALENRSDARAGISEWFAQHPPGDAR